MLTESEACRLLGLNAPAASEHLSAAFRRAAKSAHPDTEGGNVERFRQVIDAYHLLQRRTLCLPRPSATFTRPQPVNLPPVVILSPMQALIGASVTLTTAEHKLLVHVPAGLRTGDRLRLKGVGMIPVMIRPQDDMSILGSDIFVTRKVASRFIRDGGRIELDTHAGPQTAWLVPDMVEPVRLFFKGLGLPATGKHGAGDLFIKLEGCDDLPSAAEDMLSRFTRLWTTEAVAA